MRRTEFELELTSPREMRKDELLKRQQDNNTQIVTSYLSVGSGFLEDLPMSFLSILLGQALGRKFSKLELLSIGFSWMCLGRKIAKVPVLKTLLAEEKDIKCKLDKIGCIDDDDNGGGTALEKVISQRLSQASNPRKAAACALSKGKGKNKQSWSRLMEISAQPAIEHEPIECDTA